MGDVGFVLQENGPRAYGGRGARTGKKWLPAALAAAALWSAASAADRADVESAHLTLAAAYEVQVRELEAVIAEHRRMRDEGPGKFYADDASTPAAALAGLDGHYARVIAGAEKLKHDLLELAAWHKTRAGELRGP
jgi:hypothetical protein